MTAGMKRICFLALVLAVGGLWTGASAQLRSSGPVPADMKMSVQELYEADLQRVERYSGGRVKEKERVLEASYHINKMMAGGRIVYGDPISRMVERIADTLLHDWPQLRSELRFYTVNSPEVNAFATGQGMVFVNVGLVAQAENEAQLAFIISHEIIHYYRSHSMEKLLVSSQRNGGKQASDLADQQSDLSDQVGEFLRRHSRSREIESEADSLGLAMFYQRSPYSKEVTEGVFDVLQYGQLPFDDISFDTTWFNTPYFKLTGCWLDSVAPITSRDNYDDSRSTHPNILSRRRSCEAILRGLRGGGDFVVTTKEEFQALRDMARQECVRQEILHGQYARAFYNAWLMAGRGQLTADMAYCLYAMAMHKNHNTTLATIDYKSVQGESQQVYYAMHTMSAEQATLVALHAAWQMHRRYPGERQYVLMAEDLMDELRLTHKKSIADFMLSGDQQQVADTQQAAPATRLTKYERIKQKRKSQTGKSPSAYALTDLMQSDATFTAMLRSRLGGNMTSAAEQKTAGGEGMLIFNPSYYVFDNHTGEMKVAKSDANETKLTGRTIRMGDRFGVRMVDFSDGGLHQMVSDTQYNDFLTLCEWMNEFWLTKGSFRMERVMQPAMNDLLERYDASTVNLTAMLNIEGLPGEAHPVEAILLPFAPIVLVGMFTGTEHTSMVSMVVDARDGRLLTRKAYNYDFADHGALVDAMVYDTYASATAPKSGKSRIGHLGHRFDIAGGLNLGLTGLQSFSLTDGRIVALSPWASAEFAVQPSYSVAVWGRWQEGFKDEGVRYDNMLTVGLSVRGFWHSDFAPLGFYLDGGAHWVHFNGLDNGVGENTFGLHFGIGRNYIFFDRLLLNYEIDYAYTYGISKLFGFDEETAPYKHYGDAVLSNILSIRLGIGFIPF